MQAVSNHMPAKQADLEDLRERVRQAQLTSSKKLQKHFGIADSQIQSPEPIEDDGCSDETADFLSSPGGSCEGTPDAGADYDIGRHPSTYNLAPICGAWGSAAAALKGNIGRMLACSGHLITAIEKLLSADAAKAQRLLEWQLSRFLPLLHGFSDGSLRYQDSNTEAARTIVQQLRNCRTALLQLDPPAVPRALGEQLVELLTHVLTCEYLKRNGRPIYNSGSMERMRFEVSVSL